MWLSGMIVENKVKRMNYDFTAIDEILNAKTYESPIQAICEQTRFDFENNVLQAIYKYDVHVNKDELEKALKYDRNQYDIGYKDGVRAAFEKIREHYCSYDLDNYFSFRAVDEDTVNEIYNEIIRGTNV